MARIDLEHDYILNGKWQSQFRNKFRLKMTITILFMLAVLVIFIVSCYLIFYYPYFEFFLRWIMTIVVIIGIIFFFHYRIKPNNCPNCFRAIRREYVSEKGSIRDRLYLVCDHCRNYIKTEEWAE